MSQDELLEQVWGYAPRVRSRTVRTTVNRIRKRIEPTPSAPRHLITVPSEGYALVPAEGGRAATEAGLVGRERDHAALVAALQTHPVVGLMGPGGVGKTALARLVAADRAGSLWVDARSVHTVDELEAEAAATLGVRAGEPLMQALARQRLVVLDNVEQVDGVAGLAQRWSAGGPTLLWTSRIRVGVPGEAVYELRPLSPAAMQRLLERIWQPAALGHPVDVRPLLVPLGGLPLAAELAGSWAPLLSPAQLAARLAGGALQDPTRNDRHASLADVVDQSGQQLMREDRAALVALAACPAGATPRDAEALVQGVTTKPWATLLTLRRHSLLHRTPAEDGEERLTLLPPIRARVVAWEPEASRAARVRHAAHYAGQAQDWMQALDSRGDADAIPRLRSERANLRAAAASGTLAAPAQWAVLRALDWLGLTIGPRTLHQSDLDLGEGLTGEAQGWLRVARARCARENGDLAEARAAMEAAIPQAGRWASRAYDELARCLAYLGRQAEAWEPARLALDTALTDVDRLLAQRGLGKLHRFAGAWDEAATYFEQAHALATQGPRRWLASVATDLAEHYDDAKDPRANALYEQALTLQEQLGLDRDRAVTLLRRGGQRIERGDPSGVADLQASHELAAEVGHVRGQLHAAWRLGQWAMECGDPAGLVGLDEAIAASMGLGDPNLEAVLRVNRGHLRTERGRFAEAEEDYAAALALYAQIQMPLYTGIGMAMGGAGAAVAGHYERARHRLEQAAACWKDQPEAWAEVQCIRAVVSGRPDWVEVDSAYGPWAQYALGLGPRPTTPDPRWSWLARQFDRGALSPR